MDDTCAVCAETLKWVAYGQCGHREVCSNCVTRLRFICDDRRCCICKSESDIIFVTKALGDYTMRIPDFTVFPVDPKEGKVGQYWYHEGTKAFFDDVEHFKTIKKTCRFSCAVCDNATTDGLGDEQLKRSINFRNIEQLKSHLFHNHKLFMCVLCLDGRKVFMCEQNLYTREQLNQHIRSGDSEVDGTEIERGGFMGHPMCEFCKNPFYGDNELYAHMQTEHYTCHICQRNDPGHFEYYKNYDELEKHFHCLHFLCEDEGCLAKKFIVFASENELKRHSALEHGGRMSRSERHAALQLPTGFRYNRRHTEQDRYQRRQILRLDFTDNEIRAEIDVEGNGHPPISSSTTEPESSSSSSTTIPLERSSFPPLPKASKTKPKPQNENSMAAHIRRRNNVTVAHRTWPVVGRQPTPSPSPSGQSALSYGRMASSNLATSSSTIGPASRNNNSSNSSTARVLVSSSSSARSSTNGTETGNSSIGSSSNSMARVLMSAKTTNTVRPIKDEQSASSMLNFPPISASLNKPTTSREDVQTANKALIEKIRAGLEFDDEKFGVLKVISAEYRQGLIETGEYVAYIHQFGLVDLIPEIARLCPDPQKQRELLKVCNNTDLRGNGIRINEGKNSSEVRMKKGSSRKGKEKIEDSIISSVRELQLSYKPSQEGDEVLSKEGYGSNKGKSKVIEVDEPPGLRFPDMPQPEPSQENKSKKVDGGKKVQKKSKFLRARLGDDSPAAVLNLSNTNSGVASESSDNNDNLSESLSVRSVWQNGGGNKLVGKLATTRKGRGQ